MNNVRVVVGIITKGRRELVLRLVSNLHNRCSDDNTVQIILVENGSCDLQPSDLIGFKNQLIFTRIGEASIPKARNYIFNRIKDENVKLAFIDDDCIPEKDWIEQIKNISFGKKVVAHTGSCTSVPRKNIFAQTSQILYQLWIEANVDKMTHIASILDTKNVVFNTAALKEKQRLFSEQLVYATDVELAARLIEEGFLLHYYPQMRVFHQERTTLRSFFVHCYRLSLAYRKIRKSLSLVKSVSLFHKFKMLLQNLPTHFLNKLFILFVLLIIYFLVTCQLLINKLTNLFGKARESIL